MAKAKVDPAVAAEAFALQTLNVALTNPTDPLFVGASTKVKLAAETALKRGWIASYERAVGKKKIKSFQITPAGVNHALTFGEPAQLIKGMSGAVESSRSAIAEIESQLRGVQEALQSQTTILERLIERVVPPNLNVLLSQTQTAPASAARSPTARVDQNVLASDILRYLLDFQRRANAGQLCTLKELYNLTADKLGASIGEFHECLRHLYAQHKIRLIAWGLPMFELQDELCAMIAGKEVKFYAQLDE